MAANSIGPKIQVDGVDSYYKDIQRIIQQGKNLGKQMEAVGNDFDNAGEKTSTFAEVLKANLTSEAIISAVKNLGSALREVGAAVLDFVKDSVNAYAELEQNIGGSEAVFGEYAKAVQGYAADAYKTMATTQSDYLATANKMGALFQGSGLTAQRSMELTTQAMQRAADMASVMGIDTQSALDAVTGAAKGNYTMMDNLGVAMNATTLDAYAMSKGYETAFNKMSNAEKAEIAMQYFFEKTSQYAGNFEREATETISGSLGQLTAAVQTWVAGLGNASADVTHLTQNIVDAFNSVVANVTPVVQNIISQLPVVVQAVIPAITSLFPQLLQTAIELVGTLADGVLSSLPQLIDTAIPLIVGFIEEIVNNLDKIIDTGIDVLLALINGIINALPRLIEMAPTIIMKVASALIQNTPQILAAGIQLILALIQGFLYMIGDIGKAVKDIGKKIVETFKTTDLKTIGTNIIRGLWDGIVGAGKWLWSKITGFCNDIVNKFKSALDIHSPSRVFADVIGQNIAYGIGEGYEDAMSGVARNMTGLITPNANVRTTNLGGVNIVVNGAEGQNVNELADIVMQRMQSAVSRREAVFA
jgi:hypothetical protein